MYTKTDNAVTKYTQMSVNMNHKCVVSLDLKYPQQTSELSNCPLVPEQTWLQITLSVESLKTVHNEEAAELHFAERWYSLHWRGHLQGLGHSMQ